MKIKLVLLAAAALLFADVAAAQVKSGTAAQGVKSQRMTAPVPPVTPLISGTYIVSLTSLCQLTFDTKKDTETPSPSPQANGDIALLETIVNGNLEQSVGTATFDSGAGTMSFDGRAIHGDIWIYTNLPGGVVMEDIPDTITNAPYSNTATTLTINGQVYHAVYAGISGGIVQTAMFNTLLSSGPNNHCSIRGIAVKQ